MTNSRLNCERVSQIWCDETAGYHPTHEERQFVLWHVESCSRCTKESYVIDCLRANDDVDTPWATDDLEVRRQADEALGRYKTASRVHSKKRHLLTAGLSVAAVLMVGLAAVFYVLFPKGDNAKFPEVAEMENRPPDPVPSSGAILLASGGVSRNGKKISIGQRIREHEELRVDNGQAVVEFPFGTRLFLDRSTSISTEKLDGENVGIVLEQGFILAEVDPEKEHTRFSVKTREGIVTVTGTVFSVSQSPPKSTSRGKVEIQVMRGSVQVTRPGAIARTVTAGQTLDLIRDELGSMTSLDRDMSKAHLDKMTLCQSDLCAELSVSSLPTHAKVFLDDRFLGITPLVAEVGRGHYTLSLTMEDYGSVREIVTVAGNEEVTRTYDLKSEDAPSWSARPIDKKTTPKTRRPAKAGEREDSETKGLLLLLGKVRQARKAGDWNRVSLLYQDILSTYPDSFEALSSGVSLGYVQLEYLGEPGAALFSFEHYLASQPEGSLAQEAAFGKALALGALGNRHEEKQALETFIRKFPTAIQVRRAEERLGALMAGESAE